MIDEEWVHVSKVWFITGTSRGFGCEWAEAAPERDEQVAATARKPEILDDLVDKYGECAAYGTVAAAVLRGLAQN